MRLMQDKVSCKPGKIKIGSYFKIIYLAEKLAVYVV